ncbi:MAG TPA: hypothetical protein VFI31_09145 [Pirellulales bacterium]|nr:hypothetical protein [Pirellulales bacterium]
MLRFAGPLSFVLYVHVSLAALAAEPSTAPRPLPTEGEAKVLAALGQVTAVDFSDQPLSDVVEFLRAKHKIDIQLDNKALTDAGVGTDTPMTATLEGISLRSLLRLLLGQLDLTYIVGDGYLMITSKTEAENMLRLRVYPVRDLVTAASEFLPDVPLPAGASGENYSSLMDLIQSTVAPTTWDEVGGPGSTREYRNSHGIALTQTEEVHEEIAELLSALRRVRDEQIAAAKALQRANEPQPPAKNEGVQTVVYRLLASPPFLSWPSYTSMGGAGGMGGGTFRVADDDAERKDQATEQSATPATAAKPEAKQETQPHASAATAADEQRRDEWVQELARTLPELVEPANWPAGDSSVTVVAGALVIRQTPEVQEKIAEFLVQLLPGRVVSSAPARTPSLRLRAPGVQLDWPQEAQPGAAANEAAIEKALATKCAVEFREEHFDEAMKALAAKGPVRLWLDAKALTDAGVGMDTPITRSIEGVSLRTAFKLILRELDLTYVIRNEVFMITSKAEAESLLVTKVYPVFDLVATKPDDSPRPGFMGYHLIGSQTGIGGRGALDFNSLIDNIQSNVEVNTWDEVGGAGSMREFVPAGALVISQTTEFHERIAAYLRALREVAVAQQ